MRRSSYNECNDDDLGYYVTGKFFFFFLIFFFKVKKKKLYFELLVNKNFNRHTAIISIVIHFLGHKVDNIWFMFGNVL